jgi:hypothetical protein
LTPASHLGAIVLLLGAIIVSLIIAERLGQFDPPQDPEAFQARLEIAREYIAPIDARVWGPNSKGAKKFLETISGLRDMHPQFVDEHRAEVEAIYAKWRSDAGEFQTASMAYFFARHFSADDLRAKRDKIRGFGFGSLRRLIIWEMNKSGVEYIGARSGLYAQCLIFDDVIPALMELGMPELKGTNEIQANFDSRCRGYEAMGWFDPAHHIPD